jgi:hypothetical protein
MNFLSVGEEKLNVLPNRQLLNDVLQSIALSRTTSVIAEDWYDSITQHLTALAQHHIAP